MNHQTKIGCGTIPHVNIPLMTLLKIQRGSVQCQVKARSRYHWDGSSVVSYTLDYDSNMTVSDAILK